MPSLRNRLSVLVQRRLQIERRGSKRLVPLHRTLCMLGSGGSNERVTAVVDNLSYRGAGVLAEREYVLGTVLPILLVNASHTYSLPVELKVVRSSRVGSHQYLIAGPFARPMSHEELVPFLV